MTSEVITPGFAVRTALRELDSKGVARFDQQGSALEKLLVLLGDKYRESVSYPLDRQSAGKDFFKAHFSDLTACVYRPASRVARNLRNFSGLFAAGTASTSRLVSATAATVGSKDHMTGLYAMPGRRITSCRTDAGTGAVTVGLSMLHNTTPVRMAVQ